MSSQNGSVMNRPKPIVVRRDLEGEPWTAESYRVKRFDKKLTPDDKKGIAFSPLIFDLRVVVLGR